MYRRILVGTDFSPAAEAAINQALWIARKASSEAVVVAHVLADLHKAVRNTSYLARMELLKGDPEVFEREIRLRSDRKLQKLLSQLDIAGLNVKYETLLGTPYVELIHAVLQEHYDLVVTATRGLTTIRRLLVGSTAQHLVRLSPTSVWIVKAGTPIQPRQLLVACDFSDASRRACIEAQQVARWAECELHLLHVIDQRDVPDDLLEAADPGTKPASLRGKIRKAASEHFDAFVAENLTSDTPVHKHLEMGTPWQSVQRLAKKLSADLIALGTVGRSGIQGLLLGNTAERVLQHCDSSLLVAKPSDFVSPIPPATWKLHPGPAHPVQPEADENAS